MPYEYRTSICKTESELEEAMNSWSLQGYHPHCISTIFRKAALAEMLIPALVLVVRKLTRKPRKGKGA